jgi:hypothetical protein
MTDVGRRISRVLVLARSDHPLAEEEKFDLVVPLFWAAPETLTTLERRSRSQVLPLSGLVPEISVVLRETYRIAHEIVAASPTYREVLPLLGFETVLADSLLPHVIAGHLLDELAPRGETGELAIAEHGPWANALEDAAARRGADFRVRIAGDIQVTSSPRRSRLATAALDTIAERDWRRLVAQPAEHFGPLFRRRRPQRLSTGGTWCYASYVNYSRAIGRHRLPEAQWPGQWSLRGSGGPSRRTNRASLGCG